MLQNYLGYPLYQMQHVEVQKSGSFVVTERAECMRKKKIKEGIRWQRNTRATFNFKKEVDGL